MMEYPFETFAFDRRRGALAVAAMAACLWATVPTTASAQSNSGSGKEKDDPYIVQPEGDQGASAEEEQFDAAPPDAEDDDDEDNQQKQQQKKKRQPRETRPPPDQVEPEKPAQKEDKQQEQKRIEAALKRQIFSAQEAIPIYQIVEEMIDEVVLDIRDLRTKVVSPVAMRKLGLTPNLSDQFGNFVEATLVNALANDTELAVKRCRACESMRSRVEDGDWVVSMGLTNQKQLQRAARQIGVKSFMTARFSYFPAANVAALNVEITRAKDGKVLWSETYRSDATTAAILRSGDREKTRQERVDELERKIEERPYYGYTVFLGTTNIPYDSPTIEGGITGASIGLRLYEEWGAQRRWRYGVGGEAFLNFSQQGLLGGFFGATLQYDVIEPDLNWPTIRTGPTISGFFSGFGGADAQNANSGAIEWGIDIVMQFRLGAGFSVMYFIPTEFAGSDLGGFSYKARISFNW